MKNILILSVLISLFSCQKQETVYVYKHRYQTEESIKINKEYFITSIITVKDKISETDNKRILEHLNKNITLNSNIVYSELIFERIDNNGDYNNLFDFNDLNN